MQRRKSMFRNIFRIKKILQFPTSVRKVRLYALYVKCIKSNFMHTTVRKMMFAPQR